MFFYLSILFLAYASRRLDLFFECFICSILFDSICFNLSARDRDVEEYISE
ncbi:hypothetical protein D920_00904 [Enterococcus faecalis 13-SD-W-01]|nr:hypothetical protein D920_00904 [Enterococcus faecalis 13-SD-W-01]